MAVFQDIGQIERHYERAGVSTFLASAQAKMFLGVRDYDTAKLISDMLGTQTIDVETPIYEARARHEQQRAVNDLIFGGGDPFQVGMELGHWERERTYRDKVARALMTPDEILNMPKNRSLLFLSGEDVNPVMTVRQPYYENPATEGYFQPNPFHVW